MFFPQPALWKIAADLLCLQIQQKIYFCTQMKHGIYFLLFNKSYNFTVFHTCIKPKFFMVPSNQRIPERARLKPVLSFRSFSANLQHSRNATLHPWYLVCNFRARSPQVSRVGLLSVPSRQHSLKAAYFLAAEKK